MAGFFPFRTEGGATGGEVREFIIENSATITLGDTVDVTAGFAGLVGATARIMGVVNSFAKTTTEGSSIALDTDAAGTNTGTRSGNAGVVGSDTFVAASDNQTVDKVLVKVLVDPSMEYFNDADDSLTQAMIGTYFDQVATSDQIDVATSTTFSAQMILMKIDPFRDADASKGIFRIVESQLTA